MNDLWPTIGHMWPVNLIVTMIFMGLWPECIPFYASLTLFNDYISLHISVTWSSFLLQCVTLLYNIICICDLTHFVVWDSLCLWVDLVYISNIWPDWKLLSVTWFTSLSIIICICRLVYWCGCGTSSYHKIVCFLKKITITMRMRKGVLMNLKTYLSKAQRRMLMGTCFVQCCHTVLQTSGD